MSRPMDPRVDLALVGALCLGGAVSRAARLPLRWNQISLAYGAYHAPFVEAWERGDLLGALGTFVGLHPPLYSLLFTAVYEIIGRPGALLGLSWALSVVAIGLTGLAAIRIWGPGYGWAASLLLAASLYHQHYSLEINNYPLLVATSAASLMAFAGLVRRPGRGEGAFWAVAAALAVWSHLIGAFVVAAQALFGLLHRETRRRVAVSAAWVVLLCLPMAPRIWALTGTGSTYHNELGGIEGFYAQVVGGMVARFGPLAGILPLGASLVVGVGLGLRRPAERTAAAWLGVAVFVPTLLVAATTVAGISAAHQHPYYLAVLPAAAALVARVAGPSGPLGPRGVWVVLLALPSVVVGVREIKSAQAASLQHREEPHAVDEVMASAAVAGEAPGRVLWLIAPPLHPDDDKLAQDPVYDRLDPWWRCRFYTPASLPFEFVDYQYGQPWACQTDESRPDPVGWDGSLPPGGLVIHTFTDIYPRSMPRLLDHHLSAGSTVEIVLYDTDVSPEYPVALEALLTAVSERLGAWSSHRRVGRTHRYTLRAGGG